ncbi:hypothetical protein P8452_39794 [Trifolium repens]|nr:hypothetical protein P8452_39794 [Trifolium repens]
MSQVSRETSKFVDKYDITLDWRSRFSNSTDRVWFEGHQVGGWTQVYGNILSFATIRGASHEAPFSLT